MSIQEFLSCIRCDAHFDRDEHRYVCECGGLLELLRHPSYLKSIPRRLFDSRLASQDAFYSSGVWRFHEALLSVDRSELIAHPEGNTRLYLREELNQWVGLDFFALKHEGENPSGSFKDRGMAVAVSQAKRLGAKVAVCASTGNTSSSLAAYAAQAGIRALVFLPKNKITPAKLAQALAYGAECYEVDGSFDDAMRIVRSLEQDKRVYIVNSVNPFRLEGQKTIIWELFQNLNWNVPDWIFVPGGNLGNTSAFGKAISEAYLAGWIDKKPRLVTVQASGASPFSQAFSNGFDSLQPIEAETIATAIRIGNPVNYEKAKRVIKDLNGLVVDVDDEEILTAKNKIDSLGIGCEPASACALAGVKKLVSEGIVSKTDRVVGVLTGHLLKDIDCGLSARRLYAVSRGEDIARKIFK